MNSLKYLLIFATFMLTTMKTAGADKKLVCFWNPMASNRNGLGIFTVKNIDPHLCTHIVYGYFSADSDGTIYQPQFGNVDEFYIYNFVYHRKINPNLQIIASIGGPDFPSNIFEQLSSNDTKRVAFADKVFQFVKDFSFDGVDLYWPYPKATDKTNFVKLLAEVSKLLKAYNKSLTISVAPNGQNPLNMYELSAIDKLVDSVYLDISRLYDIDGMYSYAVPHAPLRPLSYKPTLAVESIISSWISSAFPLDKIIPGIPTYGRSYTLRNAYNYGVGATVTNNGHRGDYGAENIRKTSILPYNEICYNLEHNSNWRRLYHADSRSPYAVYDVNQWISFDDVQSVLDKVNFAITVKNLGGIAFYDLDMDDFANNCGYGHFPLINAARRELFNKTETGTEPTPNFTTPNVEFSCRGRADGNYQNVMNCRTFYMCANGYKYLMNCPGSLYYHEDVDQCLYRPNNSCVVA
ncbi:chitinase-3-like protein 2 [Chironomus tepperi]|uniref:chitinase-3-like protein 2 n=1 Tax=Chironomus tepperi TaxID=113505 RepID=UPI00391EF993